MDSNTYTRAGGILVQAKIKDEAGERRKEHIVLHSKSVSTPAYLAWKPHGRQREATAISGEGDKCQY